MIGIVRSDGRALVRWSTEMRNDGVDRMSNGDAATPEAQGIRSQSMERASLFPVPTRWTLVAGALMLVVILVCDIARDATRRKRDDLVSSGAVRIDINTAGKSDLMLLPGVGPARADDILQERRTNGVFEGMDDLTRVSGISERTVRDFGEFAVCSSPADPAVP